MSERTWRHLVTIGLDDNTNEAAWNRFIDTVGDDFITEAIQEAVQRELRSLSEYVSVRATPLSDSPHAGILISKATSDRISADGP